MRVVIRCRPQQQRNTSSILFCTIMASVAMSCCCTAFTTAPIRQSKIAEQLRAPRTYLFEHHDQHDCRQRTKQQERQHKTVQHNFQSVISATFSAIVISSMAVCLPSPVVAGLLDEYGAGMTINTPTAATAGTETDKSTSTSKTSSTNISGGNGVQIDPTLRGSYYYPTAKKRYLPRILKASDALEILPEELTTASRSNLDDSIDWERLLELVATVDDAVLPLQLYQSSLTGQGLSLNNDYATNMKSAALRYERSAKQLATIFQINSKNKNPSSSVKSIASNTKTQEKIQMLLVELKDAMNEYRVQGRLTNADNINIPSATPEEMRRMAMRNRNIVQISDK